MGSSRLAVSALFILLFLHSSASLNIAHAQSIFHSSPFPSGLFYGGFLTLPMPLTSVPPAPLPARSHRAAASSDPTALHAYDLANRRATIVPSVDASQKPTSPHPDLAGSVGVGQMGSVQEIIVGTDGRTRVTPTTSFPWRTITSLLIAFPDGNVYGCSGALVGRADGNGFHVLTAGHCVYSHDAGGWATGILVVPGLDNGFMPFNYAIATNLRTYSGWVDNALPQHDWAVITLDRRIGNLTGWMGRLTVPSSHPIYSDLLNLAGYPGDKGSNTLWFDGDSGDRADEFNHTYFMDTAGGQSGAPVWTFDGTNRYIVTVHTAGLPNQARNVGTRLNQDKFDRLTTWLNSDALPTDRPDLIDDGDSLSSFTPTVVTQGATTLAITSSVRNVGTAAAAPFCVSYYASADTTVTTADHFLGTGCTSSSLAPFSSRTITWQGAVSTTVPPGTYRVGWIIDAGNTATEFDETNNGAIKTAPLLTVIAGTIPVPVTLGAAVLPGSRSVQIGRVATAFATMLGTGGAAATGCSIAPLTNVPATFTYQPTNASTNAPNGPPNTPVNIPAGGSQSFLIGFTPTAPFNPTDVQLRFDCTNTEPAPIIPGVNTLLLSATTGPTPDIVALAAVGPPNNGIVTIPGPNATGAFAVATVNVGSSAEIAVSADTGFASLPLQLSICQTNPLTGACIGPVAASPGISIGAGQTPTFAVFVKALGPIGFDPGVNRVFVRFKDTTGATRGATSVAIRTP